MTKQQQTAAFLNGFLRGVGEAITSSTKEAIQRAAEGAAEGVLSVAMDKLNIASSVVEESKDRVRKTRAKVRRPKYD